MLLFWSEEHLAHWCEIHKLPIGAILSLEQVWLLANLWYHNRLDLDFSGHTVDLAVQIFEQVGLNSDFWRP